MPIGIFDNLVQLKFLFLDNNKFVELPKFIFYFLVNLRELYLYNNDMVSLPYMLSSNQLETFLLGGNQLTDYSILLRSLNNLILARNKLSTFAAYIDPEDKVNQELIVLDLSFIHTLLEQCIQLGTTLQKVRGVH